MPRGGVSARAARRSVAPWWEELDSEAFREFPTPRRPRIASAAPPDVPPAKARRAVAPTAEARRTVARPAQARRAVAPTAQARRTAAPPAQARRTVAPGAPATPSRNPAVADGHGIEGRRTVTIRGYGAERNLPMARPTLRRHERPGFKPDRAALWAVFLGVLLILVASASAHAAVVSSLVR
jgi:hypothetical protein